MMEGNKTRRPQDDKEEEEKAEDEYVLMDLDAVIGLVHISLHLHLNPSNMDKYYNAALSKAFNSAGSNTLNPTLIIDGKIELIGEYDETIGTCLVFSETDAAPILHDETGPSEANLFLGTCIVDNKQTPAKQVKPITHLHKILKFRLLQEADIGDSADKQVNTVND